MLLSLPVLVALVLSACGGQGAANGTHASEGDSLVEAILGESGRSAASQGPGAQLAAQAPLDFSRIGYDQGSPDAPIKVVEISDFGCGYCRVFNQEIFPVLKEEFIETGKVQWKFVPFVLGMFPNGDKAALAGECAAAQGEEAFLRMRNRLFADQAGWRDTEDPDRFFAQLAGAEELEEEAFTRCLRDGERADQVQMNVRLGKALGTRGTPSFIVEGLPISGALPVENFRKLFEFLLAEDGRPSQDWLPPPPTGGGPSIQSQVLGMGMGYGIGPMDAPVQVIEFSDFGCGYCRLFQQETRPILDEEYVATGKVRWTYVPFVLGMFPNGDAAAVASECAGEQGRFDPVRHRLYQDQQGWRNSQEPSAFFTKIADEEGLDSKRFAECLQGDSAPAKVQANTRVGQAGGVRGTPAFFINGFPVSGALPLDSFRDLLDLELSSAVRGSSPR